MTTDAIYEERGSDWSRQVSVVATTRWMQRDQTLASFPGPARSSLAVRNSRRGPSAWARSSRDMCHSLRHVRSIHSTGVNDVIDELAPSLELKEAHRDHSNGSCANLRKC